MAVIETVRDFEYSSLWLILLGIIPYADHETLGVIPGIRAVVPTVEPIYLLELSWTERARLLGLIIVPIVDGEWLKLLFDADVTDLISDA